MSPVTVDAAKTDLSKLIEPACAGEDVVIARGTGTFDPERLMAVLREHEAGTLAAAATDDGTAGLCGAVRRGRIALRTPWFPRERRSA